jgi:putative DNA methylase
MRKKLIEVALPLDSINAASVREKSIRHGHPATLHLWWARRPLAAARAVIFAQMVDDPSAVPEEFPTPEAQERERRRLFALLSDLVQWENSSNERVLEQARREIRRSWARHCLGAPVSHLSDEAIEEKLRTGQIPPLPGFHDPFAGGGTLPLEAQRLGLEAWASDLNPVAVLINKAMIEIPPRFAGQPPVNPEARQDKQLFAREWKGAQGLAEDVRYYGQWMRAEAEKRIGHLYPKVEVTAAMAADRPDLQPLVGQKLTVIAWLWARTVRSPNPAFQHVEVPLVSSFILSGKAGREAYVEPVILESHPSQVAGETPTLTGYYFTVKVGKPPESAKNGTKLARGANFQCLLSGIPIPGEYIKAESMAGRMGERLIAIVAEGPTGRVYLPPAEEHERMARSAQPSWKPDQPMNRDTRDLVSGRGYGFFTWADLFTPRQLVALTTFSDLVGEAMEKCREDYLRAIRDENHFRRVVEYIGNNPVKAGLCPEPSAWRWGSALEGGAGAQAYAEAVGVYLAFAVDKCADYWSSICSWHSSGEKMRNTFGRQAIPMVWDFAEANPLCDSSGNWMAMVDWTWKVLKAAPARAGGAAAQDDAQSQSVSADKIVSTDPPYYDNIGYADLSDFFYVWLRRTLKPVFSDLFATLAVPKAEELVATPYRHGSKEKAEQFFMDGMTQAMHRLAAQAHPAFPVTIYYAFKQAETLGAGASGPPQNAGGVPALPGVASTGWETFLDALIDAGFAINGTWPMRTEMKTRQIAMGANALASSIVLVCRPRPADAPTATRREFVQALKTELPPALAELQKANIAPVDLAQAAIGPGMAVFTRYAQVLDPAGRRVPVREALKLINATLDEVLAEQEGDFDADTRWAIAWFEQYGFEKGEYGEAETLSKAKNTSVEGLVEAGVLESGRGRVRLLKPEELPADWDPATDPRLTDWEIMHHLIRVLERRGEPGAAGLVARLGARAATARELAYRLYTVCERRKRAKEAFQYNTLVQSWPEIARLAQGVRADAQGVLFRSGTLTTALSHTLP